MTAQSERRKGFFQRGRQSRSWRSSVQVQVEGRRFLLRTYYWMVLGLALTGLVSWWVTSTPAITRYLVSHMALYWGLLIGEIVLVGILAGLVHRMSTPVAAGVFLFYAALNGVTLSVIFLAYTQASIARVFFITAGTFAAMSVYGAVTKRDLSGVGHFAMMGLIGFLIAIIVNIFLQSSLLFFVASLVGVVVFVLLTAYDTQMIVEMGQEGETRDSIAISGALSLYLDFINLFIILLTLFGGGDSD